MPQPIRIVSYNIRHGTDYRDYPSMDRIVAVLSDLDADVIALQEVDMNLPRSGRQKQAAELARRLNMGYVFGAALRLERGYYGNAMLSRLPILAYNTIPLPDPEENRCLLQVNLNANGYTLGFFATHLGLNHHRRVQHIEQSILPAILDFSGPVILAGDFNATSDQKEILLITQHLTDCFDFNSGVILSTFPSYHPAKRIDYIFVNSLIQVQQSYIIPSDASDHLPVTAEIML